MRVARTSLRRGAASLAVAALVVGSAGDARAHSALLWIFDKPPPEQALVSFPGFDVTPLLDDGGAFTEVPGHLSAAGAGLPAVATGEAGARYYEFTVTPRDIRSIDLEQMGWVGIGVGSAGETPTDWKLTLDGVELARGTLIEAGWKVEVIDLNGPSFQNLIGPLTFRIHAWGASSPAAYAAFDSLFLSLETAESIPALPGAAWGALASLLLALGCARALATRGARDRAA